MTEMDIGPVVLEGRLVRVEPLTLDHLPGLVAVGLDPELWRWTTDVIATPDDMRGYVERAIAAHDAGTEVPFTILERASSRVVGSTRYLTIDPLHRRLEIGYSWVAPPWQRSGVNLETKLLLVGHAFETLGANRVEFKTDSLNEKSRAALLGIGATEEGIFRNHMITQGGRRRHSAYYSVIVEEWPEVRAALVERLDRRLEEAAGSQG
jgi:RimJ/RimL family protein N-acetyltransferase